MLKDTWQKYWPVIIISASILAFHSRLFIPTLAFYVTPDYGRSDAWHLSLANKYYYSQELKLNRIPLWNPNIGTGFPTLAEGQTAIFYLPNLILFRILPLGWAYNISLIFAFLTTGIGTYLFCRSLKLSKVASTYAGTIFPLSGFFVFHVQHHNLIQAASLMPWLFWSTNEYISRRRNIYILLLIFLFAQQIFTGFPQITFYSLFMLTVFLLLRLTVKNYRGKLEVFTKFTVAILTGILLSSIQLIPSYELLKSSSRDTSVKTILSEFPYKYTNLLQFIDPYILGSPKDGTYPIWRRDIWGIFWENNAYTGLIPLVLSIGLFANTILKHTKPRGELLILFSIFSLSIALALGKYSPAQFIFSFPPFPYFRVPSRMLIFAAFSMIIASSYYVHSLNKRKLVQSLVFGLSAANLFFLFFQYNPTGSQKEWLNTPEHAKLIAPNSRVFSFSQFEQWTRHLIENGWKDDDFYFNARNNLDVNSNLIYNIRQFSAFESLLPKRTQFLTSYVKNQTDTSTGLLKFNPAGLNTLSANNVQYIVTSIPVKDENVHLLNIIQNNSYQSYLYKIDQPALEAYFPHKITYVKNIAELTSILSHKDFNPLENSVVESATISQNSAENKILHKNFGQSIEINTLVEENGLLVISNSYYPGWVGYIDGTRTRTIATNINQTGIEIPPGDHTVTLKYEPRSVKIGASVSTITFIMLLLYLYFNKELGSKNRIRRLASSFPK